MGSRGFAAVSITMTTTITIRTLRFKTFDHHRGRDRDRFRNRCRVERRLRRRCDYDDDHENDYDSAPLCTRVVSCKVARTIPEGPKSVASGEARESSGTTGLRDQKNSEFRRNGQTTGAVRDFVWPSRRGGSTRASFHHWLRSVVPLGRIDRRAGGKSRPASSESFWAAARLRLTGCSASAHTLLGTPSNGRVAS